MLELWSLGCKQGQHQGCDVVGCHCPCHQQAFWEDLQPTPDKES